MALSEYMGKRKDGNDVQKNQSGCCLATGVCIPEGVVLEAAVGSALLGMCSQAETTRKASNSSIIYKKGGIMKATYKTLMVYIDENENILAIPTGESVKYGIMGLDMVFEINVPYSDQQLEIFLKGAIDKCYSQKADDSTEFSSLEKHLNVKGFAKVVKNRRLVNFDWYKDSGYEIVPTIKKTRQGFVHIEEKIIKLGKELKDGELPNAFRQAMKLSTT